MKSITDLYETSVEALHHFASEHSNGAELDAHWNKVLPELELFVGNQIWLILQYEHIDNDAQEIAWVKAQEISRPDALQIGDEVLSVHVLGRLCVWGGVNTPDFFDEVSNFRPPGVIEVSPTRIIRSIVFQWRQLLLMGHYINEIVQRNEGNDFKKHSFGVLLDPNKSEDFRRWHAEAVEWLQDFSRKLAGWKMPSDATREDREDAGHNAFVEWWAKDLPKLLAEPFHVQMRKKNIIRTAIDRNISDEYRWFIKQPKHVSLDGIDTTIKMSLPDVTPQEPVRPLNDWQIEQLDEILGKTGREIFVCVRDHPDLIDGEGQLVYGAKKEVAKKVGCAPSMVGVYWGKNGKIQQLARKISEIL